MDSWHRNVRLLHQIDEFLDVDPDHPHFVADFIALIDAVREGLYEVDEGIQIPDTQINLHFLTKLKSRPEWREWAMAMLRDSRINASNPADCLSFRDLAKLALKQEQLLLNQRRTKRKSGSDSKDRDSGYHSDAPQTPRSLTQSDINSFVVQEMRKQRASRRHSQMPTQSARGHMKRPSQEEINEYVIRQMHRDQEQLARSRSQSQPVRYSRQHIPAKQASKPVSNRCNFCGDTYHQSTNCWRRWRVAAEALQGNVAPKFLETKAGLLARPGIYLSGFSPY
ncbi:hypothetical protein BDV18DRAFT_135119 [Aspergillus unguis]